MPQYFFNSVADMHHQLNLKSPTNPLVSVVRLEDIPVLSGGNKTIVYNFYALY